MSAGRLLRTAHIAGTTYVESGCGQRAAAISYHVLFSLVPFLALLLTVLDLLLPDSTHDRVVNWLVGTAQLPIDVSTSVEGAIQQAGTPASVAGAIALVGFIWAASGMMGAIRLAFMAVWRGDVRRPYVRGKVLDGALVLGAGLLILTAFGLTIVVQVATETSTKIAAELGLGERATGGIGALAQLGASLALVFAAFALLYRVVPPIPVRLLDVLPGAAFATIGVHLAVAGFSVYLDNFADFDDIYGPLGAVLAFLLLVWVTAAILLVGACVAAAWPQASQPVLVEAEGPLTAGSRAPRRVSSSAIGRDCARCRRFPRRAEPTTEVRGMLARLHTIDATPDQYEAGLRIVRDDLLPWARESSGFCGAVGLVDRDTGKALLLTLWSDEEARTASADAADRLSSLAANATGARRESIDDYDVSIFDVVAGTTTIG